MSNYEYKYFTTCITASKKLKYYIVHKKPNNWVGLTVVNVRVVTNAVQFCTIIFRSEYLVQQLILKF